MAKKLPTAKTLEMHKSCAFTFGQLTNNFTRKLWVKEILKHFYVETSYQNLLFQLIT